MAKRVIWSLRAKTAFSEILEYWDHRNKSKTYSKKLNKLVKEALKLIQLHPLLGKPTDIDSVRIKVVRDYHIFYEIKDNDIIILIIWDTRRDERKLELK